MNSWVVGTRQTLTNNRRPTLVDLLLPGALHKILLGKAAEQTWLMHWESIVAHSKCVRVNGSPTWNGLMLRLVRPRSRLELKAR